MDFKPSKPDPYAVFVARLHAEYMDEQLELGVPANQALTLEDYSHRYQTWLRQQYKETLND